MRSLLYSALIFALCQCKSDYRALAPVAYDQPCAARTLPRLNPSSLYQASINVTGHHLSGLLIIKAMPDSTWRTVFTNEAGVTFVDIGFKKDGSSVVHHAIRQLNRKAVLTTLKKDFALIIGLPFQQVLPSRYTAGDEVYFGVRQKKESYYFITRKDCASLQRMERGSVRKRVVSIDVPGTSYPTPSQLVLQHHTFDMQMKLNRIERE
ncbi:MAG TPA: hypothetical protein VK658_24020 [Chryseolinea sp.]|nr:hypothetical protein [Chryseolinea sp.]